MANISKSDLTNLIAEHNTFETKKAAGEVLDILITAITDNLTAGNTVYLGQNIGGFSVKDRAARNGVNPSTGEALAIPAKKVVKFKASAKLSAQVAGA